MWHYPSIITPVTSFFITGSPVMAAIPAMFPCIIIGNIILVVCVGLLRKKCGKATGFPVSIAIGAILKGSFHGNSHCTYHSTCIFACSQMHKMLPVLQLQFSVTQLITAVIGGVYAVIISAVLKKTYFSTGRLNIQLSAYASRYPCIFLSAFFSSLDTCA